MKRTRKRRKRKDPLRGIKRAGRMLEKGLNTGHRVGSKVFRAGCLMVAHQAVSSLMRSSSRRKRRRG